jgi:hypothetical protein
MVPFHKFNFSGTWPNFAKTNIQFEYYDNQCAIIPVELYKRDVEDIFSLGLPEIPEVDIEYQDADPNDSCDGGGCAI